MNILFPTDTMATSNQSMGWFQMAFAKFIQTEFLGFGLKFCFQFKNLD